MNRKDNEQHSCRTVARYKSAVWDERQPAKVERGCSSGTLCSNAALAWKSCHDGQVQLILAISLLLLCGASACGPKLGARCHEESSVCQDTHAALECREGAWVAIPCRGQNGCKRQGNIVSCDMMGNQLGDLCASTAEGKALCTADGMGTLRCISGQLRAESACASCSIQNDVVSCTSP